MTLTASQLFTPLPSGVSPGVTPAHRSRKYVAREHPGERRNLPVTSWQPNGTAWNELLDFAVQLSITDANVSRSLRRATRLRRDSAPSPTSTRAATSSRFLSRPTRASPRRIQPAPRAGSMRWRTASTIRIDSSLGTRAALCTIANTSGSSLGHVPRGRLPRSQRCDRRDVQQSSPVHLRRLRDEGHEHRWPVECDGRRLRRHLHAAHAGKRHRRLPPGCGNLTFGVVQVITPTGFNLLGLTWNGIGGTGGSVWSTSSVQCVADVDRSDLERGRGPVTLTTTSVPGGAVSNVTAAWSGAAYESNVALAARCRYKLQSLSVNGPKGAYAFAALTSSLLLAAQSPPATITSVITRVTVALQLGTGIVTTTVASANGAVPGISNLPVLGATNASPIVLTVPSTAGITSGMVVKSSGIVGNTAANGLFAVTLIDGTDLALNGSVGNGAYVSGGNVEAGDLGLVDSVIQSAAVPNGTTAQTQSAAQLVVAVSAVVYVPSAFLADYGSNPVTNKGATALAGYFPTLPIGGVLGVDGQTGGVVPISAISDLLFHAGQSGGAVYTMSVGSLTLNGSGGDVRVGSTQVAVLGAVNVQVVGV